MSELKRRALELCSRIDIDGDSPTRGELLVELCETLVGLARECDDVETLDAWRDVYGFLNAAVLSDLDRIGGAA